MQLKATALSGKTMLIMTGKGEQRQKAQLRVMDIGPEAAGGDIYWVDFWGEDAFTEEEWQRIKRQEVMVEVRRVSAKAGNGRAFLNISGGAILLGGQVVQRSLRSAHQQPPSAAARAS